MAAKKSARKATPESAKSAGRGTGSAEFTEEERAAMRDRVRELKRGRRSAGVADEASEVLAKIAAMTPSDRAMAQRIHAIVTAAAPNLTPRLWYGMPAYAKSGKVLCFFQGAQKFKTRYATLGFVR